MSTVTLMLINLGQYKKIQYCRIWFIWGDVDPNDLRFEADQEGDLTISTDGYSQDSITLNDDLYGDDKSKVAYGVFANGSEIAFGDGNLLFQVIGAGVDQILVGTKWGATRFEGVANGDNLNFGQGSTVGISTQNVVDYQAGDGAITISANGVGQHSQIDFGSTTSDYQLQFAQSTNDLLINIIGTSDIVDIQNWFGDSRNQISQISDGNGDTISNTAIDNLISSMAAYSSGGGATYIAASSSQSSIVTPGDLHSSSASTSA